MSDNNENNNNIDIKNKSIFYIMNGDTRVATIELFYGINYLVVLSAYDIKSNAPADIVHAHESQIKGAISYSECLQRIENWLKTRSVDNYRPNFDKYMLARYKYTHKRGLFGRMFENQYTFSMISYFATWHDNYWVSPAKNTLIYYGFIDYRYTQAFILKAIQRADELASVICMDKTYNENIMNGVSNVNILPTLTDTLHARVKQYCYQDINKNVDAPIVHFELATDKSDQVTYECSAAYIKELHARVQAKGIIILDETERYIEYARNPER